MSLEKANEYTRRKALKLIAGSAVIANTVVKSPALLAAKKPEVVIIGAGLAGLNAALHLQEQGIKVVVLEASARVGGRIYTRDDLPDRPEAGGYSIGNAAPHTIARMQQLALGSVDQSFRSRGWTANIGGQSVAMSDWADSQLNKTVGDERAIKPSSLEGWMIHKGLKNPLKDRKAWLDPAFKEYDKPLRTMLLEAGYSEEAVRLAQLSSNSPNYDDVSALHFFRKFAQLYGGTSTKAINIKGGSSRLPEAMAAQLEGVIQLNKQVATIDQSSQGVRVQCKDGAQIEADYVICAIPFSAAKDIQFKSELNASMVSAISNAHYVQTSLVHVVANKPFWEDDGLPPAMWTDSALERVYKRLDNEDGRDTNNMTVWVTGDACANFDAMTSTERADYVLQSLGRLRPSTKGSLSVVGETLWNKNQFAKGVYHMFKPGQISEFGAHLSKPSGRYYFAGEHTAVVGAGIEGAMESGERAASQIINAIG